MDISISGKIVAFAAESLTRYPASEVRDVYKLLYQAYHGPAHGAIDFARVWEWLQEEWEEVQGGNRYGGCVFEPIYVDGITPKLYRVHLGPAKAAGLAPESILHELIRTTELFPDAYPDERHLLRDGFVEAWTAVGQAISSGRLHLSGEEYESFSATMTETDWLAAHHSDSYRKAYNPHYRLVMEPFAEKRR